MSSSRQRVALNGRWGSGAVDKQARAARLQQRPLVLWLTGLCGAGKSTIAGLLEGELHGRNLQTYLLDGDSIRQGLTSDLGYSEADRAENIRRVSEVARLMVDAGLVVIVSLISPFRADRRMARSRFEMGEFVEIFVDTPLHVAEARDPKGLYQMARRGHLRNFTGIDSPYESPEDPEIRLDTTTMSAEDCALVVLDELERTQALPPSGANGRPRRPRRRTGSPSA